MTSRSTLASSFAELPLDPALLTVLAAHDITVPSPIQGATIPDAVAGRDVLGRARTGSGKTLAFGLALLTRLSGRRAAARAPLALVLVPTRELAQQVAAALTPYAGALGLRIATVVGGLPIGRQADALRRGTELVIATPGRLTDLLERGDCRLEHVEMCVLDEADQMADMGFLPQVTTLLERTAANGQRLLFSATLDRDVDRLVRRFLVDPATHSMDPGVSAVTTMEHHVLHVERDDKNSTTAEIGARDGRVIMFVGTRHRADRLTKHLLSSGVPAAALHGGKTQPQRTRILDQFRTGIVNALVATDVAARGIHIDDLDLVVNVDPPADHKDYLHRSGRTARAGRAGTVVTLVLPEQRRETKRLLAAAGVTAGSARVRPGDDELARITGARTPAGVPVEVPNRPVKVGGRTSATAGDGRRGRRERPEGTRDRTFSRPARREQSAPAGERSARPPQRGGEGDRSRIEETRAPVSREARRAPLQDRAVGDRIPRVRDEQPARYRGASAAAGSTGQVRAGGTRVGRSTVPGGRAARAAAGPNSWQPREGGGKRLGTQRHRAH